MWALLLVAVTSVLLRAPGPTAKDEVQLSDVRVWANTDFVEVPKYHKEMAALHEMGVSPMVRLELRDPKMSTMIVPELEFRDLLRVEGGAAPRRPDLPMNESVARFVSQGKVLVMTLTSQFGLNYPLQLVNEVFKWHITPAEVPSGVLDQLDIGGLGYAFADGPKTLPCTNGVHAVQTGSLPPNTRCVYGTASFNNSCALAVVPVDMGAVVLLGYPSTPANTPEWDSAFKLAAQLGRRFDVLRRENATLSGIGNTLDEPLDIYGSDLARKRQCVAWRRTLNCNPTGPRDQLRDRNCTDMIPPDESGYCECGGNQLTAAAGCSHSAFTCRAECWKVGQQFRDVFGEAYQPPTAEDMIAQLADADAHLANARYQADKAVQKVSATVTKANDIAAKNRASLQGMPNPWEALDKAGRESIEAGQKMAHAVEIARHSPGRGANVAKPENRPWWVDAAPPPWWAEAHQPA